MIEAFIWKVIDMKRRASDGMVESVQWLVEAADGEIVARRGGQTVVSPAPPETFIPFENLTETICIGWVHAELGYDVVAAIETNLVEQIQKQVLPTILQGVPWPV